MPRQFGFYPSNNEPDQAERRTDLILADQHGREYHVVYDTAARGVIRSYPRFNAPWMPEEKHLKYVASRGGAMPDRIEVDYEAALAENHRESDRYFHDFLAIGGKLPGVDAMTAYDLALAGEWEQVPRSLLHEVGQPPVPDDYIKACMAGNKWALGMTNKIPEWAHKLIALEELRKQNTAAGRANMDLDKYADVEEQADPQAVGGKRVKVGK